MTSLYTEVKIIKSITTVNILVNEIICKFREQIQKYIKKIRFRSVQERNFYFLSKSNYSLCNFIIYIITYSEHYTEI